MEATDTRKESGNHFYFCVTRIGKRAAIILKKVATILVGLDTMQRWTSHDLKKSSHNSRWTSHDLKKSSHNSRWTSHDLKKSRGNSCWTSHDLKKSRGNHVGLATI
jgi:hypothetical protein